jgi:hypothetical protein
MENGAKLPVTCNYTSHDILLDCILHFVFASKFFQKYLIYKQLLR